MSAEFAEKGGSLFSIQQKLEALLASGSGEQRRPVLRRGNESNIDGVYVVGDLAGAPVIKLAMAQGYEVIETIAERLAKGRGSSEEDVLDVLIVGAGAAGLNAALAAQEKGLRLLVLEKEQVANTIENFPEGKWVYAEPDDQPPKGKLWLDGARKEDMVRRWHEIVEKNDLPVHVQEPLLSLERDSEGILWARSSQGEYRTRTLVLATGQRGNPRKLGVPGEDLERVYHRLYSPRKYHDEDILIVGGGNSAVEAALILSEQNRVRLSYRRGEFARLFQDNRRRLDEAVAGGQIEVLLNSKVQEFRDGEATLEINAGGAVEERTVPMQHGFVLIGAELPVKFLNALGIRLENDWRGSLARAAALTVALLCGLWLGGAHESEPVPRLFGWALDGVPAVVGWLLAVAAGAALVATGVRGDRWSWLGFSFFLWYSIYGIKLGTGEEFWPYRGWGYEALTILDRPWSFWYTVLYTMLMTVFGIQALRRWGLERRDKFQIWRFVSLLAFQWTFFFLVPEYLFQWAVEYQWVGERLAENPQFADQAWRSYGLVLAWPLFFYTFFYDPHMVWVVWGVLLTFLVIPVFVLFHGKRYCSWICGCGGLAETFGDRWRHLAPKGRESIRWEWMNLVVLILATAATLCMLLRDSFHWLSTPAERGVAFYRLVCDVWLVGILPVTLYPFLGGKVWCRYWCPLAKFMGVMSKFFARRGLSRFGIVANDKCIGCHECSRNCQIGIPVMQYALEQKRLDNETSSCIGCGICVTVCPMDALSFAAEPATQGGDRSPSSVQD